MIDYTLYPIRKTDVDWPLYHLVGHFLKIKYKIHNNIPDEEIFKTPDFNSFDNDVQQAEHSPKYYFVFPREDLSVPYNEAILRQEYVILKCTDTIEIPDPKWFDEDNCIYKEVPLEYFHYDESNTLLRHGYTKVPNKFPIFPYVGSGFSSAVNELIRFFQKNQLTDSAWYPRLQMVASMLNDNVNELHILHNAGLYDHKTLWSSMKSHCISPIEIEKLQNRYLTLLKQYAMFTVNELNWNWGTPVFECEREDGIGFFGAPTPKQLSEMKLEQERRLKMFQDEPSRS